jgi:para-nitrobenzyl esterase
MKIRLLGAFVVFLLTGISSYAAGTDPMALVVNTKQGLLRGITVDSVCAWKGIAYATPPLGDLRFQAPQPPASWTGIKDASQFGPASPQSKRIAKAATKQSEDCLSLNIWSPAADGKKRPVMFWIHGGGFLVGSNSTEMYDGASLARTGDVVVVNINYRLGALGFLYLNDIKGKQTGFDDNLGIRDQIAALQWVRDNIAAFGGDPEAVTIFGESAGAISVLTLMGTPSARGLFKRAIVESAPPESLLQPQVATEMTRRYLKLVGVSPDSLYQLKRLSTDSLVTAMFTLIDQLMHEPTTVKLISPTIDGTLIPLSPMEAIQAGKAAGIDMMIGTNKDEATLLSLKKVGLTPRNAEELQPYLNNIAPEPRKNLVATYKEYPSRNGVMEMTTDGVFTMPSIRVCEMQSAFASTYMYHFEWYSGAMKLVKLKSCHGAELPFVFGTLDRKPGKYFAIGSRKKYNWALSKKIQESWVNFARYGNPDPSGVSAWTKYNSNQRSTMIFDKESKTLLDPDGQHRIAWTGLSIFKQ